MTIEEIFNNYGLYIYKYAYKLVCDPQKAEDISQETFISAWKNIDSLKDDNAIKKWLRKICLNHFLMYYRKNVHANIEFCDNIELLEAEGKILVSQKARPEEEVIVSDSIKELQNGCFYAMVRKLTLYQRITFSLIDMFGITVHEVAELLEISESATKGLLHRARINLDSFFDGHCNLLDENNPCSFQSWIDFRNSHEKNQYSARKIIESLDKNGEGYAFNQQVRNKISYLYQNMPDVKPYSSWYEDVITAFKSK
jgi:RNA polymerase sigma-70 factor (ECF subfamily)